MDVVHSSSTPGGGTESHVPGKDAVFSLFSYSEDRRTNSRSIKPASQPATPSGRLISKSRLRSPSSSAPIAVAHASLLLSGTWARCFCLVMPQCPTSPPLPSFCWDDLDLGTDKRAQYQPAVRKGARTKIPPMPSFISISIIILLLLFLK